MSTSSFECTPSIMQIKHLQQLPLTDVFTYDLGVLLNQSSVSNKG